MHNMKIEYKNHKKTIYSLAYRYHRTTGIEIEELISSANEEFVKIQKKFNPSKACFNTYLTLKVKGLFWEMARKNRKSKLINVDKILISSKYNPEKHSSFNDLINNLSNDAKEIIKIAFNTPREMIDMLPKKQMRGINKTIFIKYLRTKNWSLPKISAAIDDISKIWDN